MLSSHSLRSLTIEEAKEFQFRLIDCVTRAFRGDQILESGDYGVPQPGNQPERTRKIERVLADFFQVEDTVFVIGAGTGALRESLSAVLSDSEKRRVLVHTAPVYSTTDITLKQMNACVEQVDFHEDSSVYQAIRRGVDAMLIQHARQSLNDHYDMKSVIRSVRSISHVPIITDENYAVMKVSSIGAQMGADLSAFSMFKLLGPEGVGLIIGKEKYINRIRSYHYSGGSQIQGPVAMEALRGMIYAPVALAIQAEETHKTAQALQSGVIPEVREAIVANAQSKVLLVHFQEPIAERVLMHTNRLGAAPYPVGSESKYEFVPMFYRISGTMRAQIADAEKEWIRINVMRAGHETVLHILRSAIQKAKRGEKTCF